jgi:hypothetical protein
MPVPLNFSRRGPLTSDEWAGRGFLLIAYVTYVLSNALVLQGVIPVELKHVEFIFIAAMSLLRQPMRSLLAAAVALPIALIYVLGGLWPYSAMVLVLAMSLPMMWEGVRSVVSRRDYRFLLVLALIAMIPAVLSLQYLLDEGLFDTTYGRSRVLLGYFHPKEAAIAFAVPMLLAMLMTRSSKAVPLFVGCIFLWLVGSRNIALLIFLAWALRWHGRWAIVVLLTSIPVLTLWLFQSDDWYGTIDNMLSLRLSVWTDVLSTTNILTGLDIESGDRFGTDNFFLEALVIAGPMALPLIFAWTVAVGLVLRSTGTSSWTGISFVLLLFIATFDSGIASTGNIMHVLLWSIMLSPLFHSRLAQQSVFTSIKSTGRMTVASASR